MIHFLVASQRMALVFYFLPTLYSAYYFGRRHATMTASASVALVIGLTLLNPAMFSHHHELVLPIDTRWIDLTIWGGVLVIAAYAMGTLYERNQKSLIEMKAGYEGMLAVLQQFLTNQKYSEAHSYRISMYATRIAESLGLDSGSTEDIRTAATRMGIARRNVLPIALALALVLSCLRMLFSTSSSERLAAL